MYQSQMAHTAYYDPRAHLVVHYRNKRVFAINAGSPSGKRLFPKRRLIPESLPSLFRLSSSHQRRWLRCRSISGILSLYELDCWQRG